MSEILERELQETDLGAAVLDELDEFIARYVSVTEEQRTAMLLYAGATHIIRECVTFPRMLFTSEQEESGKTLAMDLVIALSTPERINASGTGYGLDSALMAYAQEQEKPVPLVRADEISDIFGRDGMGTGSANRQIVRVLREGYKCKATSSKSRNGVQVKFSIFTPVLMTGLRTAIPRDIRSRSIVINMKTGEPPLYFDIRDAESAAERNGEALGSCVRAVAAEIHQFRALDLRVPKLVKRKAEVWEPLLAVAYCLGGERWLKRAIAAFKALALAETDKPILTEKQRTLQAIAELAPHLTLDGFVSGNALGDELRRLDDPLFSNRTATGANVLIANAMPVLTQQRRLPSGQRMRGYMLNEILAAWDAVRPPEYDDEEEPEEYDPFAVNDDEDDEEDGDEGEQPALEPPGTGGTGGTGITQQLPQPPAQPPLTPAQALAKAAQAVTPQPRQRDGQQGKGGGG